MSGVVITDDTTPTTIVRRIVDSEPLSASAVRNPRGRPRTSPMKPCSRKARKRAPNVGHQRPLTRWKERRSALVPRCPSAIRTGKQTDHATPSQTAGQDQGDPGQDEAPEHEEREPDQRTDPAGRCPQRVTPVRHTAEVADAHRPQHRGAGDQERQAGEELGDPHAGQKAGESPAIERRLACDGVERLEIGVVDRRGHQRREDLDGGDHHDHDPGERPEVPPPDLDGDVDNLADREGAQVGNEHGRQRNQPPRARRRPGNWRSSPRHSRGEERQFRRSHRWRATGVRLPG